MSTLTEQIKKLPDTPGVYLFKDTRGTILYIGKATSLRDRVRSYFSKDILTTRGPIIAQMLDLAVKVDYEQTDSVLEALILEAELIRKYKPKHNTDLKDDKSWNYVVVTNEEYPRVLLARERVLEPEKYAYFFGPFTHGGQLKEAMKIVRKIFPFRDTCTPNSGKPCFNAQIGLCPGVCSGVVSKKEYARNIKNLALFFQGKKKSLIGKLEREMKVFAKKEAFEKANAVKKTIFALSHIQDVSLLKRNNHLAVKPPSEMRIECYDVAHISGAFTVGVMTVVENGEAKKSEYRKFKIKGEGVNDTKNLGEMLSRRLEHPEWPFPKMMVVDGGLAQKNVVDRLLEKYGYTIPVLGVVKDEHHRPRNIIGDQKLARLHEKEILLGNSEAHRFAIAYHKKLRGKMEKAKRIKQ
ncbi:MAG: GIY-YIG nuclease family protein [Candidatus Parcubacteria bacterium]|nr:GIY-YIG nuclease family protein [Candidatus Parcubacteria bacterium]